HRRDQAPGHDGPRRAVARQDQPRHDGEPRRQPARVARQPRHPLRPARPPTRSVRRLEPRQGARRPGPRPAALDRCEEADLRVLAMRITILVIAVFAGLAGIADAQPAQKITIGIYAPSVEFGAAQARLAYVQGLAKAIEQATGIKTDAQSYANVAA